MIKGGQQLNILADRKREARQLPLGAAVEALRKRLGQDLPGMAIVLGSGFQKLLQSHRVDAEVNIKEIPEFPRTRVKGHSGKISIVEMEGLRVLVLSGRAHYYEGHSMEAVMFPVRVLAECGVRELLLTNAAGGINPGYQPGEFMLFSDHINLIGVNPLRGLPVDDGRCFVDLSDTYCAALRLELQAAAREEGIPLHEGVYLGVSGPSYETPAEIRAFRMWGADAVGMSTIPEALMGRYCGLNVAAVSCITNRAAGIGPGKLSHEEVLGAGEANAANAARLFGRFASRRKAGVKP